MNDSNQEGSPFVWTRRRDFVFPFALGTGLFLIAVHRTISLYGPWALVVLIAIYVALAVRIPALSGSLDTTTS